MIALYTDCKYGRPLEWHRGWLHESEASQALIFCFDNASLEKSCFVINLVHFILPSLMPSEKSEIFHREESALETEAKSSRSPKEQFKFRLEDLSKCVSDHIQLQVIVNWLNAFTGFNDGAAEVHLFYTVVFVLSDSV